MKLVAYTRVSTEQQVAGESLSAQLEAIEAWAAERGDEVVQTYTDAGLSGTLAIDQRPELASALVALADGAADALVFVALDRLARALHEQEAILSRVWSCGARVFEVRGGEVLRDDPDDPMRTFLRQVMGAASQLEAGMVRLRMKQGRRRLIDSGEWSGGGRCRYRFGSTVERGEDGRARYVPVPEEQDVIRRVKEMREQGLTLRAVAAELTADGTPAPTPGGRWHPTAIRTIARRAA